MYDYLKMKRNGSVAILTMFRPPVNALCNAMVDEMDSILTEIEKDPEIRVLIVTGSGPKAFMAGADINELRERDFVLGRKQTRQRQAVYNKLAELDIPVIAAVNGYALGAGLELALACTIRIASENARFGCPEVNLGIIPGDGATQRLPRMIGLSRAMYMILTGESMKADEAAACGLIAKKVPAESLMTEALAIAEKLTGKGPLALQYAKEAANRAYDMALPAGLAYESYLHALSCASSDKEEGVNAFNEKRKPDFQGK